MTDLRDLYQELILDHSKRPRNFGALECGSKAHGDNPLCGDRITVYLKLSAEVVQQVQFEGSGCAISTASASLMTELVRGKSLAAIQTIFDQFHDTITGPPDVEVDLDALGKLAVLAGVRRYPMRVKCASLAWHTLQAAIRGECSDITTE